MASLSKVRIDEVFKKYFSVRVYIDFNMKRIHNGDKSHSQDRMH